MWLWLCACIYIFQPTVCTLTSYPDWTRDAESAVKDSTVPSSASEWDSDWAAEWESGVKGMRSCMTPPTGYAHAALLCTLAPVCCVNLKSWGNMWPRLPSAMQRLTCRVRYKWTIQIIANFINNLSQVKRIWNCEAFPPSQVRMVWYSLVLY